MAAPVLQTEHDDLGRATSVIDPNMSNCDDPTACPWSYEHDLEGRVIRQTTAAGGVSRIVYDSLGRKAWKLNCADGVTEMVAGNGVRQIDAHDHVDGAPHTDFTLEPGEAVVGVELDATDDDPIDHGIPPRSARV